MEETLLYQPPLHDSLNNCLRLRHPHLFGARSKNTRLPPYGVRHEIPRIAVWNGLCLRSVHVHSAEVRDGAHLQRSEREVPHQTMAMIIYIDNIYYQFHPDSGHAGQCTPNRILHQGKHRTHKTADYYYALGVKY